MKLDKVSVKSKVCKPPKDDYKHRFSIFLAGSIEMGKAEDWQTKVEKAVEAYPINVYNPRRDDWDDSWKQSMSDENFAGQVAWEFEHLGESDIIFLYFDPTTKSPISMMELGLFAKSKPIIVVCPDGFWRKGNIEYVCDQFDLPLFNDLKSGIKELQKRLDLKDFS